MELLGITFGLGMQGRSHQDINGAVNGASSEMSADAVSLTLPDLYPSIPVFERPRVHLAFSFSPFRKLA